MAMKIAMIGPFGLHPNQTMRSRALKLAQALVPRGHEVALFMPPWHTSEEADQTWQEEGVTLRYIPLRGGTTGIARRLVREALDWQPDVVHCFKPKAYSGLAAWWLWHLHRHKIGLVMDTDDWEGWGGWNDKAPYSPLQKRFFARQEQWGMRHCHVLTVASRALETIALSMGIAQEQVLYLPNGPGIHTTDLPVTKKDKRPSILVYSRLFEFDTGRLVEILRGVQTAVPDLHILLVGAGLYEADAAQFRQQLQETGLLTAVTDVGWVEKEDLPQTLLQGDVGIYLMEDNLLNRTKCPVKLADQLALGIPIVGEAVGQVSEYVVQGRTGLIRPSGDNDGIIQDLIHLLQHPAERKTMAQNAIAHMQIHFAWEKLAAKLEVAYWSC